MDNYSIVIYTREIVFIKTEKEFIFNDQEAWLKLFILFRSNEVKGGFKVLL